MSSKMLAAAGVAVIVAIGAYFYTQSSKEATTSDSSAASVLRSHIPADSLAFMLSQKALPLDLMINTDPSLEQFAQMASAATTDQANPLLHFWGHLGSAYLRALQSGEAHLKSEWGFADDLYSAAFFVGLSPVVMISMAEPAKFSEQVRAAAKAAGLTLESTSDGAAKIHRVTFYEDQGRKVTLLLRESEGWLRLAVELPGAESTAALVTGSELPQQSLANSDFLTRAQEPFRLRGDIVSVANFAALGAILTDPQSTAGDMLSKMLPDLDLSGWQTPACQEEVAAITATVPQWLALSDMEYDGQAQPRKLTSKIESLLSIRSEKLAASLTKLNGVVPDYSDVDDFSPLYSFALGVNVGQLAPVLMELHQAAMQQTYTCTYLQNAQAKLKDANPVMLGMATAMVSGVKGISFTLNSLALGEDMKEVEAASALVSLSAESVRQLLMLAQGFVPQLGQLTIPDDGTAVPLQLAMLPSQVPSLYIAIKDDHHALIMTGDDSAKRLAETFTGRGLDSNGLLSLSLDAGELVQLIEKPLRQGFAGMNLMDAADCAEMDLLRATYKNTDLVFDGEGHFSAEGLWAEGEFTQVLPDSTGLKVNPGAYDLFFVGQGCEPQQDGTESFAADGSGVMTSPFFDPSCDGASYEAEFTWQQRGLGLHYTFLRERERGTCNGDWSQWEDVSENQRERSCVITEGDDQSFRCVFTDAEDNKSSTIFRRAG